MTNATTETLGSISQPGLYGWMHETRLVRTGSGRYYLIHDQWCGSDIEGRCYRAHVYAVPDARVDEVLGCLRPDGFRLDEHGDCPWSTFAQDILPDLHCYGRQSDLAWAANL
jgi:hypothetical protein